MKLSAHEIEVVEAVVESAEENHLKELNDLQLACIGGGIAELVPY